MTYDIIIAGAGIVGVSTAYQLLQQSPDLKILILEKEVQPAMHQTGHNSGVIHSGIYYKPGSYKAWNCIQGYKLLIDFCEQEHIEYKLIGKLIVASNEAEINKLNSIYNNGIQNGLKAIQPLTPEEVLELEPNVRCKQAILVPQAGIIDYKRVVNQLIHKIQKQNASVITGKKIIKIDQNANELIIHCSDHSDYKSRFFINCSGLQSDRLAILCGQKLNFRIIPFKGNYYKLKNEKKDIVQRLIYPVPDPQFPFLGIHYTRLINGDQTLGPNAILVLDREGYKEHAFNFKDFGDIIQYPGFWRLIQKHWKIGLTEYRRNYSKAYFAFKASEMTPGIEPADLEPSGSGIRAQLVDIQGNMVEDFVSLRSTRMIHVCNAPSPAATAGLSIGKQIADWYFQKD